MTDQNRLPWKIVGALAGWAASVRFAGGLGLDLALGNRMLLARSLCEAVAGSCILLWAGWRNKRLPRVRGWRSLLLLGATTVAGELLWRPYIDGVLHVHSMRAGMERMVLLVAPLWLALLAGLQWVPDVVPRRSVGAAVAALAAYCLLLQGDDLTLRRSETPALLLCVFQAVTLVWAWSYARRELAGEPVAAVAGSGLLVLAAVHGAAAASIPNNVARSFVWAEVWGPLLLVSGTTAIGGWLWYWLLLRVELVVFSMQVLVLWLSTLVVALPLFGFVNWRVDLAMVLGVVALLIALRARVDDEEPVRLGIVGAEPR